MPLSWKSQRCAYLPRFCKVEHTGITGVYIFSTPLLSPDLWIIYFSSPFVLVSLLAQKVFLASRPWKYLLYFFVRVFVEFSPLAVEILFFLKQAARLSSQGQYHKQKKHTPWEKKVKVLPLRHTVRDDDHTDDVNLHLKLTACVITLSR